MSPSGLEAALAFFRLCRERPEHLDGLPEPASWAALAERAAALGFEAGPEALEEGFCLRWRLERLRASGEGGGAAAGPRLSPDPGAPGPGPRGSS